MAPDAPESPQEAVSADVEVPAVAKVALPVDGLRTAAMQLRRPFTADAVKWKVQASWDSGCLVVPYIDARLVVERLNLVVPDLWFDRYTPVGEGFLLCELTVDGITRIDVGEGKGKAGYSDALKRAGVKFGVGVSLYAIPKVTVDANDAKNRDGVTRKKQGQKNVWALTNAGRQRLREIYAEWLAGRGGEVFGVALDHGDVEGAAGDVDVDAGEGHLEPDNPDGELLQLLEGSVAEEKRKKARKLYAALGDVIERSDYPPAQFQAGLDAHGHSLEALDEFVAELERRLEDARKAVAA